MSKLWYDMQRHAHVMAKNGRSERKQTQNKITNSRRSDDRPKHKAGAYFILFEQNVLHDDIGIF